MFVNLERDFIRLFAPHVSEAQLNSAKAAQRQQDVDALFAGAELPVRNGCDSGLSVAA